NRQRGRHGYARPPVVMGAMITYRHSRPPRSAHSVLANDTITGVGSLACAAPTIDDNSVHTRQSPVGPRTNQDATGRARAGTCYTGVEQNTVMRRACQIPSPPVAVAAIISGTPLA